MKKYIIIVLVILIIVFISVFMIHNSKRNVNVSNIKSLTFSYSQGYMANSGVRYELECKDKCILSYKANGVPFDEATEYNLDESTVLEVEELLNKYNVSKWNGFNKSDQNVLDGDSFGFYLIMQNGDSISASGYMKWPDNYAEVKEGLDNIFAKVVK